MQLTCMHQEQYNLKVISLTTPATPELYKKSLNFIYIHFFHCSLLRFVLTQNLT